MPQQQSKQPDFIPAQSTPDFIPAEQPQAKMSANDGLLGGIQDSFDENTKTDPKEPLLETGLKSVVGAIGQPFVHPIGTATGMAKSLRHPLDEAHQEVDALRANPAYEGTKMAGNLFGNVALGAAAGAAPGFAGDVADAIPTRAKAGKLFDKTMAAAKDQPVDFSRSMPHLERTQQLAAAGASPLRPADLLYNRINTVNPVPYGEARDFASNLSRMSAADKMATNPQMAREASLLSRSLNQDIGDAADKAGVGDDYRNAMSTYRSAARNSEMAKTAGKMALKAGKYALPAGAAAEAIKHFSR